MYLFFDTETGGLTPTYSLLTATFIAVDADFSIISVDGYPNGLTLQLKYPEYFVTPGALAVNNIDIVQHDRQAVEIDAAREQLLDYLRAALAKTKKRALIPAGHNVEFDRRFVQTYLLTEEEWDRYMTYPVLDTAVIARFLASAGQHDRGFSLGRLVKKFLPELESSDFHNSEIDTLATIMLAKKFVDMCTAPA